jgi:hypothetical protein
MREPIACMKTETQLVHEMLVTCEVCFLEGPAARLREHIATDHKELFWPELVRQHHACDHADFPVTLPGRFWNRLARIETQTGRTFTQIVAGALDAQGLGRRARPRSTE